MYDRTANSPETVSVCFRSIQHSRGPPVEASKVRYSMRTSCDRTSSGDTIVRKYSSTQVASALRLRMCIRQSLAFSASIIESAGRQPARASLPSTEQQVLDSSERSHADDRSPAGLVPPGARWLMECVLAHCHSLSYAAAADTEATSLQPPSSSRTCVSTTAWSSTRMCATC